MVGKKQLDIKNKIILGVDLLHRANISINSNGHQFALIARMTKENGQKARVRLQQHIWAKDVEVNSEALQNNATELVSTGSSKLFFNCEAKVKNKNLFNKTVTIEPMYNLIWEKEWPVILDSNLLKVKNLIYKTPMTKTLKLKVTHSLETNKCLSSFSQSASDHKKRGVRC